MKQKNVVVIGGGTGTYTVLSGLKKYPVNLTAIVSMADDGGSNQVIRDEFGLLPTSDIRQCLVALAEENGEAEKIMRNLFMHRFDRGTGIKGMTFGNLFMAALSDILGSQHEAIEKTSKILKIKGAVLPVTLNNVRLGVLYENGLQIIGEHLIDEPKHDGTLRIVKAFLHPKAKAHPEAVQSILAADLVVLGPGDLFTSLISNLLVEGIPQAIQKTKAKIVYVMNLMTSPGQTHAFSTRDHVAVLENYIGKRCLDAVLVNTQFIPKKILQKYKHKQSFQVVDDLGKEYFRIVRVDMIGKEEIKKVAGDVLHRSLIRHDSDKLAKIILSLL